MNLTVKKIAFLLTAIIISVWVFNKSNELRKFNYENYPTPILDEFTYVWQGISLKQHHLPMAWTMLGQTYQDPKLNPLNGSVDGFSVKINDQIIDLEKFRSNSKPISAVKEIDYLKGKEQVLFVVPFLDHPPLGGLIFSHGLIQTKQVEDVKTTDFRPNAIFLSTLTTIFLFILLYTITSNPFVGLLGIIIYGTVSTYILATRTALLENAIPIFVLPSLIFLFLYIKHSHKKLSLILLVISGLLSGLSVLAKEPAIGFSLGFLILLIKNKIKLKNIFIFLISLATPILIYLFWGWWLSPQVFTSVVFTNISRFYFGPIKTITMLEALKFKNFPTDGWWIWGILSFFLLSLKTKNKSASFITIPLFTHILVLLLLASGNYPWYWVSTIPFFAASSALIIKNIFTKPNFVESMLFFFIPFSSSYYWGREALNIHQNINHYRMSFLVFIIMLFIRAKFKNNQLIKIIWIIFMSWLIYKIIIFNQLFFPYLIANWGNLPIPSLPNY